MKTDIFLSLSFLTGSGVSPELPVSLTFYTRHGTDNENTGGSLAYTVLMFRQATKTLRASIEKAMGKRNPHRGLGFPSHEREPALCRFAKYRAKKKENHGRG